MCCVSGHKSAVCDSSPGTSMGGSPSLQGSYVWASRSAEGRQGKGLGESRE